MVTLLATKHLTDDQLIEVMTRLEQELINRAAPPEDTLVAEHPRGQRHVPTSIVARWGREEVRRIE